tara:strand:+ start:4004 stop:5353 length:1350 start_codon:yes stop_codon:yes gene_type:complete
MEVYVERHYYDGIRPKCPVCGENTRYIKGGYAFRKYCTNHANEARKEWSKNNSKLDYAWKKGLTKETHIGIATQAKKISGRNNFFYGRALPEHVIAAATKARTKKLTLSREEYDEKVVNLCDDFVVKTNYDDYKHARKQLLDVACAKCNRRQQKSLWALQQFAVCKFCTPSSKGENEIAKYIESMNFEIARNTRSVIPPKELDIFIPQHKFAIEYNGLYWHNEEHKPKNFHKQKSNDCREKGIKLFHVFSDEWEFKRDIVKSMINSRLGASKERIFARKCKFKEISNKEATQFFENTHISGGTKFKKSFALLFDDELVSVLSVRTPRHKIYKDTLEIARFSSKLNTNVVGGFSKLMKYVKEWALQQGYDRFITYADLRFGCGNLYEKVGFTFVKQTPVDYWYSDSDVRYNRFKFRAQDGLSERKYAKNMGVTRVYGCGSNLYELNLKVR